MKTFVDGMNRSWTLSLNVAAIRRIKATLGIDLCDLHSGEKPLVLQLANDLSLLFDVIAELTRAQWEQAGLTRDQFEAAFDGTGVQSAADAFWEELADFFRRWKPALSQLIEEIVQAQPAATESGASSGTVPASSASTPTSTP
jgi:hypothetical protein